MTAGGRALPSAQIALTAAVALVVCVALVSHISATSMQSTVPTLSSLTRVVRWAEATNAAANADHRDGKQTTSMLKAEFPVFTALAGGPGMSCSEPDTCALAALADE